MFRWLLLPSDFLKGLSFKDPNRIFEEIYVESTHLWITSSVQI
jgi:hypothetical protein